MTAIGGPIQNVSIFGREFRATGDATINIQLGGDQNEVSMNGDGASARLVKTVTPWVANGGALEFDAVLGDQEFLQNAADENDFGVISITLRSGAVYSGKGQITGELAFDSSAASGVVNLGGPGKLTKQ